MIALLIATALSSAPASAEALRLGEQLARIGSFGTITGAMGAAQTEELVKSIPSATPAEQQQLRALATAHLAAIRVTTTAKVGAIYARHFTLPELRAITRFYASSAGHALTRETIASLPEIAGALQGIDFKGEVSAVFCKETGKLCAK